MRIASSLSPALLLFSLAATSAQELTLDPAKSRVTFEVSYLLGRVRGEFVGVEGTIVSNEREPSKSSVRATTQVRNGRTGDRRTDAFLLGPAFLDAAKHPTMVFVSKRVKQPARNRLEVQGDLTLHGITKPVTFQLKYDARHARSGEVARLHCTGETTILRKDFGLGYSGRTDHAAGVVGPKISVTLRLEATDKSRSRGHGRTQG